MAHDCPDCGQLCYCRGDVDDSLFDDDDSYVNCQHYETPDCDVEEWTSYNGPGRVPRMLNG